MELGTLLKPLVVVAKPIFDHAKSVHAARSAGQGARENDSNLLRRELRSAFGLLISSDFDLTNWKNALASTNHAYVAPDFLKVHAVQDWLALATNQDDLISIATSQLVDSDPTEIAKSRQRLVTSFESNSGEDAQHASACINAVCAVLLACVTAKLDASTRIVVGAIQQGVSQTGERLGAIEGRIQKIEQAGFDQQHDKECNYLLKQIIRRRTIPDFDESKIVELVRRTKAGGDLDRISDSARADLLYWASRMLCGKIERRAQCKQYLGELAAIDPTRDVKLIESWQRYLESDPDAELFQVMHSKDADLRSCAISMLVVRKEYSRAITFATDLDLPIPEGLSPVGWQALAFCHSQVGAWDEARKTLVALPHKIKNDLPWLYFLEGLFSAALLVTSDFRERLLLGKTWGLRAFLSPLANDESFVIQAIQQFEKARALLDELKEAEWSRLCESWVIWLLSLNSKTRVEAQLRLRRRTAEIESAADSIEIARVFKLEFDTSIIEKYLVSKQLDSTLDKFDLHTQYQLVQFTCQPREQLRFLEANASRLRDLVFGEARFLSEMLMALILVGNLDQAESIAKANVQLLSDDYPRILDAIQQERGKDVSDSMISRYQTTGSVLDLQNLCGALIKDGRWNIVRPYLLELFQKQGTLHQSGLFLNCLRRTGDAKSAVDFFDAEYELVKAEPELLRVGAWAHLEQGNIQRAEVLLSQIEGMAGASAALDVQVNLALVIGDWDRFTAIAVRERENAHRFTPTMLLQLAQLASFQNSDIALEFATRAISKAPEDAALLLSAGMLMVSLGKEGVGMPWVGTAATLSTEQGPLMAVELPKAVEIFRSANEDASRVWHLLAKGAVPLEMVCQRFNRSVATFLIGQALNNRKQADGRRRSLIPIRHAGRELVSLRNAVSIMLDISSLYVIHQMGLMARVLQRFETVFLTWSTFPRLLEDYRRCKFHQPSQITRARRLKKFVDRGLLKISVHERSLGELAAEVGAEVAMQFSEAIESGGTVVLGAPIHKAQSLTLEEAELGEHSDRAIGITEFVKWLKACGLLSEQELNHALQYLNLSVEVPKTSATVAVKAPFILSSLATDRLIDSGVLDKLPLGKVDLRISKAEIDEAIKLIELEDSTAETLAAMNGIRETLRVGIEQGKIRLLPRSSNEDLHDSNLVELFGGVGLADAVCVDDRCMNVHGRIESPSKKAIPLAGIVDLLEELSLSNLIDSQHLLQIRHDLREMGYVFLPVSREEIAHWVTNSPMEPGGQLIESKEMRAIRQYINKVRSLGWLQAASEIRWLADLQESVRSLINDWWTDKNVTAEIATARSSWLIKAAPCELIQWRHIDPRNTETSFWKNTSALQLVPWLLTVCPSQSKQIAYQDWLTLDVLGVFNAANRGVLVEAADLFVNYLFDPRVIAHG